jgi:signal transduction histidine kinase
VRGNRRLIARGRVPSGRFQATGHDVQARQVPDTGSPRTNAVLVFDAFGRRVAVTPGADELLGASVGDRAALTRRFRQADGSRLDLDDDGPRLATSVDDPSRRFSITSRALADDGGSIVVVREVGDDDPGMLQGLLGSVLAHELRTPLTTIFGGAQLVSDPSVSEATRREAAKSVAREAQRLHRVVEDLLALVRLNPSDPAALEPLLLQRVVPPVIESFRRFDPDPAIVLTLPRSLPPVLASESELGRLIEGLLSDAAAYTLPGQVIRIRARRAGGTVEIRVSDDGPGRDPTEAAHAFDLFARSPRSSADPAGANLGLVVARRLVERMGGRIWARPAPRGGDIAFAIPIANNNGL